mmetsp:Transcript_26252/g.105026  ORF Transcript_26252/g.105026 Transcript_26252/m.105026 type:complete len:221 (+) Transcript_26252:782-1444(+)
MRPVKRARAAASPEGLPRMYRSRKWSSSPMGVPVTMPAGAKKGIPSISPLASRSSARDDDDDGPDPPAPRDAWSALVAVVPRRLSAPPVVVVAVVVSAGGAAGDADPGDWTAPRRGVAVRVPARASSSSSSSPGAAAAASSSSKRTLAAVGGGCFFENSGPRAGLSLAVSGAPRAVRLFGSNSPKSLRDDSAAADLSVRGALRCVVDFLAVRTSSADSSV